MGPATAIECDSVALARELGSRALDGSRMDGGDHAAERLLVRDLAWEGRRDDLHLELTLDNVDEHGEVERWPAGSEPLEAYLDAASAAWAAKGSPRPACSKPGGGQPPSPQRKAGALQQQGARRRRPAPPKNQETAQGQ